MKIYIEVLILFFILFIWVAWIIWNKLSVRRLLKKYKPENDKGRKGNEPERTKRGTNEPAIITNGNEQSERRELLQETNVNSNGEDSKRNRKIRFFRK